MECVDEIPFADDVEDTYDDRTPDTSVWKNFTPHQPARSTGRNRLCTWRWQWKMASPTYLVEFPGQQGSQHFSPEAKEIAEKRMRAREKSVKSPALKDAMAKHLTKMKESDAAKGAVAKVAWNVPETTGKNKKQSSTPKESAVKALESKKQSDTLHDRVFTTTDQ